MNSLPIITQDQDNVITLSCAQEWHRNFLAQNDKGSIPSSIWIPIDDIKNIAQDFAKENKEVDGVRIYFAIKSSGDDVTGILVPTELSTNQRESNDLVYDVKLKLGASKDPGCPGENFVSIYNFIRPCPPYCDSASPINTAAG